MRQNWRCTTGGEAHLDELMRRRAGEIAAGAEADTPDVISPILLAYANGRLLEGERIGLGLWGARTRAEHLTWASILGTRALPPRLPAHGPAVRLADAARAQRHVQRRGDPGAAARRRGPAPSGRPPEAELG